MGRRSNAIERLRAANPVDPSSLATELRGSPLVAARGRAIAIAEGGRVDDRLVVPTASTVRARVATALAVIALIGAASLTPPGQALAERLGELVGIGDKPTRTQGLIDEPAVVIDAGESPGGTAYEVVASADMNIYRDEDPPTCIGLDLPELEGPVNAGCLTPELEASLDSVTVSPVAFLGPAELGSERLIVDGLASAEVASAEIERLADDGSIDRYPVKVSHLDDELAAKIGASSEAAFLLAFLPEELVPPPPPEGQEGEASVAIPVPAPDSTFEGGPPVIGRDPVSASPEGNEASPAKQALARLSLVAYDDEGQEIARERLDRGPFSDRLLYASLTDPRPDGASQVLEECFLEVLPQYGTLGGIRPDLPDSFGQDLNECVAARDNFRSP